jgi:hypothetical protein
MIWLVLLNDYGAEVSSSRPTTTEGRRRYPVCGQVHDLESGALVHTMVGQGGGWFGHHLFVTAEGRQRLAVSEGSGVVLVYDLGEAAVRTGSVVVRAANKLGDV